MVNLKSVFHEVGERIKAQQPRRDKNLAQLDSMKKGEAFDWKKIEGRERLAERAKRLGLLDASRALLDANAPDDKAVGNRVLKQIIGANNILGVTFLSEGARMARAVGRVTLEVPGGKRLGTGFMVSPRIMMTNNHVLGDSIESAKATIEFDFFRREDGTTGPVNRFRLQPDQFFVTDVRLDFTLLAVETVNTDGADASDRGWFPLIGPSGKAVVGERVSVIHHPNGEPQMVTVHDNKLVSVDPDSDFLQYEADTMGGSSGSPVLNINWDLVALHHAAVGQSNEGIRISAIVKKLHDILGDPSGAEHVTADKALLNELLAGKTSPPPVSAPAPVNTPAKQDYGHGQINDDGTASWVVPVTLTLGVGRLNLPDAIAAASGAPIASGADGQPQGEDPNLTAAIQALTETAGRPYYEAESDGDARDLYYRDLPANLNKTTRYKRLSALIAETHTTTLSYPTARLKHLYPWIDRREDGTQKLQGIYSNKVFDALEVIRLEAEMERRREQAIQERLTHESLETLDPAVLEALEAAHPFNCEHVVPQSWFNKRKQPRTDLHHLFTCEWGCNSFRGNRAYFDFQTEAFRDNCGESDADKFEPKHGKGAVARATLYFLLRYPGDIADSTKEMPMERLKTIIQWAKSEPVDNWERHRNAEIQKVQGNRNPLVDFPELVDKINFELGWAE